MKKLLYMIAVFLAVASIVQVVVPNSKLSLSQLVYAGGGKNARDGGPGPGP